MTIGRRKSPFLFAKQAAWNFIPRKNKRGEKSNWNEEILLIFLVLFWCELNHCIHHNFFSMTITTAATTSRTDLHSSLKIIFHFLCLVAFGYVWMNVEKKSNDDDDSKGKKRNFCPQTHPSPALLSSHFYPMHRMMIKKIVVQMLTCKFAFAMNGKSSILQLCYHLHFFSLPSSMNIFRLYTELNLNFNL